MKARSILIYGLLILLVMSVLAYVFLGVRGITGLLKTIRTWVIWGIILGLIFYGVWYFFIRKEKDDRVHLNAKRIVEQSMAYHSPFLRDLFLSGDKNHPQVRLGRIIGFSRVANAKGEQEDVFVYKKSGFPLSLFEEPKAIRVSPEDHTELIGDITIEGISLVKYGGFYFINKDYLDYQKIDQTIITEVKRTLIFDMLSDWKIVTDEALGISPEHQKQLEKKDLLKIPSRTAQGEQQGGS